MAENLRCIFDKKLFEELLSVDPVVSANREIAKYEAEAPSKGTKRHLLKTALRLSEAVSPELFKMSKECTKALGVEIPVDLFVYSSPQFNAACFKPEEGKLYIMFSSSLLEAFDTDEIKYVLGHELGHYIYQHHNIPIGFLLNSQQRPDPELALKLFEWSRYAEISADRAGAKCIEKFESVASALFKLSSGVSEFGLINFSLESYLKQIDELIALEKKSEISSNRQDWFSTHPFSPLRVKALEYFFKSELAGASEFKVSELESRVEKTLQLMEPNYLMGTSPEDRSLKDLFIAESAVLISLDGKSSLKEKEFIHKLLEDSIDIEKIDVERIKNDIPRRLEKVNKLCSLGQKQSLVRDLLLVAGADEDLNDKEIKSVRALSEKLGVLTSFVDQHLVEDVRFLD